jgi:hypothetical protein
LVAKSQISTSVGVHSLTLSHTPRSMKCDSQASLLACTFPSPRLRLQHIFFSIYTIIISKEIVSLLNIGMSEIKINEEFEL